MNSMCQYQTYYENFYFMDQIFEKLAGSVYELSYAAKHLKPTEADLINERLRRARYHVPVPPT